MHDLSYRSDSRTRHRPEDLYIVMLDLSIKTCSILPIRDYVEFGPVRVVMRENKSCGIAKSNVYLG